MLSHLPDHFSQAFMERPRRLLDGHFPAMRAGRTEMDGKRQPEKVHSGLIVRRK